MQTENQSLLYLKQRSGKCSNNPLMLAVLLSHVFLFFINTPALCQQFNANEWKFESQREAIAPIWFVDSTTTFNVEQTLTYEGGGKAYADGHWYKQVSVQPDAYFQFKGYYKTTEVDEPGRSVLARILWENKKGEQVGFTEYPAKLPEK